MVALVVASAASAMRRVAEIVMPRPVTLEEELAARGIKTFPLDKVCQYQVDFLMQEKKAGRAGCMAFWQMLSESDFTRFFGPPPADVQETIRRAKTIPGSKVVVERFEEDRLYLFSGARSPETGSSAASPTGTPPASSRSISRLSSIFQFLQL